MLILDLRWLLFGLWLVLIAVVSLTIWLIRLSGQRRKAFPGMREMESVLESAPLGMMVLENLHTCSYANPYAQRLLGLERPPCHLPDADWVRFLNEDQMAARKEMTPAGRYRGAPLNAEQFVHWWVTTWGKQDVVFVLDATSPHQAEQAAHFLISDLSHELRTPLATLLTHIEILKLPQISEEVRQQSIRLMQFESKRMARLVHDLLELGHLETSVETARRMVDLRQLLEQVLAQIAPQAQERQIDLSLQTDTPLPYAAGDTDQIRRVFLNLLDNAVKYCRPGDQVKVSLRRDSERMGIACAVCDTGPGIPGEHLAHITRRFYRATSEEIEGSGLGLAVVEAILRRHQSQLEIESHTSGQETGTCFRFVLPAWPEAEVDR
jgi:two-component system phosphate regulon sensor histidine kinase PhoR